MRTFRPEGDGPLPVVAYLHGGGWMMGTLDSYDALLRALANASGAIVAGVDYRLAPEHRYPAALDDSIAAIRWIAARRRPGRRRRGWPWSATARAATSRRWPRGACAASCRCARCSSIRSSTRCSTRRRTRVQRGPRPQRGLDAALLAALPRRRRPADPDAAPLRASDLAGVAPAFVVTAEEDVLRDEGEAYAAALREAGVPDRAGALAGHDPRLLPLAGGRRPPRARRSTP